MTAMLLTLYYFFFGAGPAPVVVVEPPSVSLQGIELEFGLGGGAFATPGFNASAFGGSGWESVIDDTRNEDPIVVQYGMTGDEPKDRIAATGTLEFTLNNAEDNAGGVVGFYSPLHALRRGGHDLNVPVRLSLTYGGVTYYKFLGRLADINPEPGRHGQMRVPCTAVDLMDDWAANDAPQIDVEFEKDCGVLMELLLDALPSELRPRVSSIEPGVSTIPVAFDEAFRDGTKIREVIADLALSELGFAGFKGDTTGGGTFFFTNRHTFASAPDPVATFINEFSVDGGFQSSLSRDDLVSSIQVKVRPTKVEGVEGDSASYPEVGRLHQTNDVLEIGESIEFDLPFRDPVSNEPISALFPWVVEAVFNSAKDGTGTPLVTSVHYLGVPYGSGMHFTLTNTGAEGFTAHIMSFRVRAISVRRRELSVRRDVNTQYGRRPIDVSMPMQSSIHTANDVADYFKSQYQQPYGRVQYISFIANKSDKFMTQALAREPGDRIYIEEAVTGVAGDFLIANVRLELHKGGILRCTWGLIPANAQRFWLLGLAGSSELGVSTVVGF